MWILSNSDGFRGETDARIASASLELGGLRGVTAMHRSGSRHSTTATRRTIPFSSPRAHPPRERRRSTTLCPRGGAHLASREDRTVSSPANPSHVSLKCSVPLFPCVKVNGVAAAPGVASGVRLCFSPTKPDPLPLIRASVPRESRSSRRSYALLVDFPIDPLLIPPTTPP